MSVSSVGSSVSTSSIASLQNHLKTDQKSLTEARTKNASPTTLAGDEAKVAADQRAISAATARQAEAAETGASSPGSSAALAQASTGNPGSRTTSSVATAPATPASTKVSTPGRVDISV